MGLEIVIPRQAPCSLDRVIETVSAAGLPCVVAMIDNVLQGPVAPLPASWRDVRLRTPAGMVTLRQTPTGVAVIVFGNADAALRAAQQTVVDAVRATP